MGVFDHPRAITVPSFGRKHLPERNGAPSKMRVPYVSDPPPAATAEDAAIVDRIRTRRAPRPLQPLDLALLHCPPVADGWNSFIGAVRTKTSLPDDVREVAICRIAVCNHAWYEWGHHAPLAANAGVSEAALDALKQAQLAERPRALDEKLWAVVAYTDEMTAKVHVADETVALLKSHFSDQEVVELTATVRGPIKLQGPAQTLIAPVSLPSPLYRSQRTTA